MERGIQMKMMHWFFRGAAIMVLMTSFALTAFGQQNTQPAAPAPLSQMTETSKVDAIAPADGQTPPAPSDTPVVASGTLGTPSAAIASPAASAAGAIPAVAPATAATCAPPSEPLQPMEVPTAPTKPKDHPGH